MDNYKVKRRTQSLGLIRQGEIYMQTQQIQRTKQKNCPTYTIPEGLTASKPIPLRIMGHLNSTHVKTDDSHFSPVMTVQMGEISKVG
jgi:hypothetical protein